VTTTCPKCGRHVYTSMLVPEKADNPKSRLVCGTTLKTSCDRMATERGKKARAPESTEGAKS
jgi:hypothetical protein